MRKLQEFLNNTNHSQVFTFTLAFVIVSLPWKAQCNSSLSFHPIDELEFADEHVHNAFQNTHQFVSCDATGNEKNHSISAEVMTDGIQKELTKTIFINEGFTYDVFITNDEITVPKSQFGEQLDDFSNDAERAPFQLTDKQRASVAYHSQEKNTYTFAGTLNLSFVSNLEMKDACNSVGVETFSVNVTNQGKVDAKNVRVEIENSQSLCLASTELMWNQNAVGNYETIIPKIVSGSSVKLDIQVENSSSIILEEFGVEEACYCLSNATNDSDGQFLNTIYIISDPAESWSVIGANNLYQGINEVGDLPDYTDYTIGQVQALNSFNLEGFLAEVPGDPFSTYLLEGISIDDLAYDINLTNGIDTITINGDACSYGTQIISGPEVVCVGMTVQYCVEDNDSSSYQWTISDGGSINAGSSEPCVLVQWQNESGGPFTLGVSQTNSDLCVEPATLEVNVGESGGAITCLSYINLSIGETCIAEITPEMVLKGTPEPGVYYTVMLTDEAGNLIPDNILDGNHVGQEIIAKIIDVCSGNSCWSTITIEDKIAPVFPVMDSIVACQNFSTLGFPEAIDACGGPVAVTLLNEVITPLTCDEEYTYEIIRSFKASDEYGNETPPVNQTIHLARIELDSIVFPADRVIGNGNPIYCEGFIPDAKGNPAPESAGIPTLDGENIYPYVDQYCGFGITYNDNVFPTVGCVTKIMRTWTAFEWWCDQSIIVTYTQVLNIVDNEPPVLTPLEDFSATTDVAQCMATVNLPAIEAVDECSPTFDVDIQFPGGFINNSNGGVAVLPLGENNIIYTVYDECGNSATESLTVTVQDLTPPVMACDQNTVISLNVNGVSYAYAETFDDGSVDDCGIDYFEVRRMDNGSPCGVDNSTFGPRVDFCCADVGEPVVVILRAYDLDGNTNECMVNVIVQDKNPPTITCPADMTILCDDEYDEENLAATFGEATAVDNCMNTTITETVQYNISQCLTGNIIRTFVASDGNGTDVCTQIITIVNDNPFELSDITWPSDFTTDLGCDADMLAPENLDPPFDYPVIQTETCDVVSVSYSDKEYIVDPVGGSCLKIVRTWLVEDECNLVEGEPTQYYYDQTIVVTNSNAPEFTSSCDTITKCIFGNCEEGLIDLFASAEDDCTPADMLQWSYNIDLNSDGSFEYTDSGNGGSIIVSEILPFGDHRIVYTFSDLCGNSSSCTQAFTLLNCDIPTAYCVSTTVGLTPMDTDGDGILDNEMATVPADIIGEGSFHPCGTPVLIAFDSLGILTEVTYDCYDIGVQTVTIYVIGEDGSFDSCVTTIEVQDNNNVDICPDLEECIIWPDSILTIDFCVLDLDPSTVGNEPSVVDSCFCDDFTISFVDQDISIPGSSCVIIERTWSVTFNCPTIPLTFDYIQNITQLNAFAPIITFCPADIINTATTADCEAFVDIDLPVFETECSFGVVITNDSPFADSNSGAASGTYPVGNTLVTYTITDECGNAASCSLNVIVGDGAAPNCNTQDIIIIIGDAGELTIADDAVNDGSTDNCGSEPLSFSTTPNTFDCTDLGDNIVVMTVTDTEGNFSTCNATVTVLDTVAPICDAVDVNYTIFNPNSSYTPDPEFFNGNSIDPCGEIVSYEIFPTSFTCDDIGVNDITLIVTDNNGNTSSCQSTLTIDDVVAPTCIVQDITVNTNAEGIVVIEALDIDNGTFDECGFIVSYEISQDTFTCDDIGDNLIIFTVTDNSGNTCTAQATVTVESPVEIVCSAQDLTVYLDDSGLVVITAQDVDNGSMAPCGASISLTIDQTDFSCDDIGNNPTIVTLTVTNENNGNFVECTSEITVLDTLVPSIVCPADLTFDCTEDISDESIFGMVSFSDNCSGSVMVDTMIIDNRNDCGVGTINRMYVVADASGNMDTCAQLITIEATIPFVEDSITWPEPLILLMNCVTTDPIEIGSFPVLDTVGLACFNISVDYVDNIVVDLTTCIDTITRIWTVIDSCQLNGSGEGIFNFEQTLIVDDSDIPVIDGPADITVYATQDSCTLFVDLSAVSATDCSASLITSNDSPFANDGNSLDASGIYPLGNTPITLSAVDNCGNIGTHSFTVTLIDTLSPLLDCVKVFLDITEDGTVTSTAEQQFMTLSDNCTDSINIEYYYILDFDETDTDPFDNPTSPTVTFDCSHVGINTLVWVLVIDESGNYSFCGALTFVSDPLGICDTEPPGLVYGNTVTNYGVEISDVNVNLVGQSNYLEQTDFEGQYAFDEINLNSSYELTPSYDKELLNGVTTLDLLLIQKHILNIQSLTSPYDIIAADINNSGDITGSDIVVLKKVLLGKQDYFTNNTSFRFVEENHTFVDPTEPFYPAFPESTYIEGIVNPIHQDYVAVKIGDVNGTYKKPSKNKKDTEVVSIIGERSQWHMLSTDPEAKVVANQISSIPVYSESFQQVQAMEIHWKSEGLNFVSLKSNLINITEDDYQINQSGDELTLVWMSNLPLDIQEGELLFTIEVMGTNSGMVNEHVYLQNGENQFFDAQLNPYQLQFDSYLSGIQNLATLGQNEPNPWRETTLIPFELAQSETIFINFYSMDGRLINRVNFAGEKGYNEYVLRHSDFEQSGIIFYELMTTQQKITKRMIKIN